VLDLPSSDAAILAEITTSDIVGLRLSHAFMPFGNSTISPAAPCRACRRGDAARRFDRTWPNFDIGLIAETGDLLLQDRGDYGANFILVLYPTPFYRQPGLCRLFSEPSTIREPTFDDHPNAGSDRPRSTVTRRPTAAIAAARILVRPGPGPPS
jgi:hypothetical protein